MTQQVHFSATHVLPPQLLSQADVFEYLMQVEGTVYRQVATRQTVKVEMDGRYYFIKRHTGVGWGEIIKNWISCKRPIVSAINEVNAIAALERLQIPTTPYVGHGVQGWHPAGLRSFVMTEDLGNIVTLETLALAWKEQAPALHYKRAIIRRVAEIAGKLHANGIYHRDFYICHFCFKDEARQQCPPPLFVLDLHRVEIHAKPHSGLQIKDLAALYFSAMDVGLTAGDRLTFFKHYHAAMSIMDWQAQLTHTRWRQVRQRADMLYQKFQRKVRQGIAM